MENKLKKWWKGMVFTCEDVTRLSFDPIEQAKLSFADKLRFKLHRSLCVWCRRYYKQTVFLRRAMKTHQQKFTEDTLSDKKLNKEIKERLKKELGNPVQ